MIFISHRGNINGIDKKKENTLNYIQNAINLKYEVEIDIYFYKNNFWLGHDEPTYKINDQKLLLNNKLWIHAENIQAINKLLEIKAKKYFWHQNDDVTLTSNKLLWTYPGKELTKNSICVMPELSEYNTLKKIKNCYGICSDFIENYKKKLT